LFLVFKNQSDMNNFRFLKGHDMRKRTWLISILVFTLIISFCCCLQGQAVYASDNVSHTCCDTEGGHHKGETESPGDCDCDTHSISENIADINSLQIVPPLLLVQEFSGSIEGQSHKTNLLSLFKSPFPYSSSPPLFNLYCNYLI